MQSYKPLINTGDGGKGRQTGSGVSDRCTLLPAVHFSPRQTPGGPVHKPSPSRALNDQRLALAAGNVRTALRPRCREELTTTYTFLKIPMKISRGLIEKIGKLLT